MSSAVEQAAEVIIAHTRLIEGCNCGWNQLGQSHARHVAEALAAAGVLPTGDVETRVEWAVRWCGVTTLAHPDRERAEKWAAAMNRMVIIRADRRADPNHKGARVVRITTTVEEVTET